MLLEWVFAFKTVCKSAIAENLNINFDDESEVSVFIILKKAIFPRKILCNMRFYDKLKKKIIHTVKGRGYG